MLASAAAGKPHLFGDSGQSQLSRESLFTDSYQLAFLISSSHCLRLRCHPWRWQTGKRVLEAALPFTVERLPRFLGHMHMNGLPSEF